MPNADPPISTTEEMVVLGIQRDNAERTMNSFKVVLSYLKASFHKFEQHGMQRRQGFDLFKRKQCICLVLGSLTMVKLGQSVRHCQIYVPVLYSRRRSDDKEK